MGSIVPENSNLGSIQAEVKQATADYNVPQRKSPGTGI